MAGFTSQIRKAISIEDLDQQLSRMHKNSYVTKGSYTSHGPGTVVDYEWNHLDQWHRNYLHDAYHDALRIATSNDIAISVMAWKNLPVYIQVADMRIARGLFYQTFSIFGLLLCFQIARLTQEGNQVKMDIQWRTVSHRWLWFLHGPFNRKLKAVQAKQDGEDLVIRERRQKMRSLGFHFKTDEPDFINSNILTDMVIFPKLDAPLRSSTKGLKAGEKNRVKIGLLELYVMPKERGVEVWPAFCSHEGAEMPKEKFCDGVLECPWHGRKFKAVSLAPGQGTYRISNLALTLEGDDLVLKNATEVPSESAEVSMAQ